MYSRFISLLSICSLSCYGRADDLNACLVEAIVVSLHDKSVMAYAPTLGVKCKLPLEQLPARVFDTFSDDKQCAKCTVLRNGSTIVITNTKTGGRLELRLFDHVHVCIGVDTSPYRRPQLTMSLQTVIGGGVNGGLRSSQKPDLTKFLLPFKPAKDIDGNGEYGSSAIYTNEKAVDTKTDVSPPSVYGIITQLTELSLMSEDSTIFDL